jgi:hypothetical protein
MCEDGSCEIDHEEDDIYIDEVIGYSAVIAEFVDNMEGFQYDE